jgi:hypothetical protein
MLTVKKWERRGDSVTQKSSYSQADKEDQSRRKEESCDADSGRKNEDDDALHNRQHAMAAVKEGRRRTIELLRPPLSNCLWRVVGGKTSAVTATDAG